MNAPRVNPLADELARTKTRLLKARNGELKRGGAKDILEKAPHKVSTRWPYACARIQRICEGAQPRKGHTFETACKTATVPKLAHSFMELYAYYVTRSRPAPTVGGDHNPFRHLPDNEAEAKFQRLVEDICDKSSAKLGSWYVK